MPCRSGTPEAVRWHFVGRLQTNKCRSIASLRQQSCTPSIAPKLVAALAGGAARAERELDVFVQVSLDGDPDRGGVVGRQPARTRRPRSPSRRQLAPAGVMAVAPLGADPDQAFERLAVISAELRERHPGAASISAGMSADLEAAIRNGATHVRVGTALLGRRSDSFG